MDAIEQEGDPNLVPWRNRPDGPRCAWVEAQDLHAADRLLLSNKYIHTVSRSEGGERGLWTITITGPTLVDADPNNPNDITMWMPKSRDFSVRRAALYRRIIAS